MINIAEAFRIVAPGEETAGETFLRRGALILLIVETALVVIGILFGMLEPLF